MSQEERQIVSLSRSVIQLFKPDQTGDIIKQKIFLSFVDVCLVFYWRVFLLDSESIDPGKLIKTTILKVKGE